MSGIGKLETEGDLRRFIESIVDAIRPSRRTAEPVGIVHAYAGATAPESYLLCDGAAISRSTFPKLFAAIGTAYGVGDGSTTFNLPDLRGRVPVGEDGAAGRVAANDARGQAAGLENHTLAAAEGSVPTHGHGVTDPGHMHQPPNAFSSPTFMVGVGAGPDASATLGGTHGFKSAGDTNAKTTGVTVNNHAGAAAASAHNNMQPYQVVNYIIRAR
jgi:microcystin-dependent protein